MSCVFKRHFHLSRNWKDSIPRIKTSMWVGIYRYSPIISAGSLHMYAAPNCSTGQTWELAMTDVIPLSFSVNNGPPLSMATGVIAWTWVRATFETIFSSLILLGNADRYCCVLSNKRHNPLHSNKLCQVIYWTGSTDSWRQFGFPLWCSVAAFITSLSFI